jgi:hypothetical protein
MLVSFGSVVKFGEAEDRWTRGSCSCSGEDDMKSLTGTRNIYFGNQGLLQDS